jgi:hypothetical protein
MLPSGVAVLRMSVASAQDGNDAGPGKSLGPGGRMLVSWSKWSVSLLVATTSGGLA